MNIWITIHSYTSTHTLRVFVQVIHKKIRMFIIVVMITMMPTVLTTGDSTLSLLTLGTD